MEAREPVRCWDDGVSKGREENTGGTQGERRLAGEVKWGGRRARQMNK